MPSIDTDTPIRILLSDSSVTASYPLSFRNMPMNMRQRRFEGRTVLAPEIDLNSYKWRAEIDWLGICVSVNATTQWMWIREVVAEHHERGFFVQDIPGADGTIGKRFRIRIQEPMLGDVYAAVDAIKRRWGLAQAPALTGLEISIDARSKSQSNEELARLFGVMVRTHMPSRDVVSHPHDRPRFVHSDASGKRRVRYVLGAGRSLTDAALRSNANDEPAPCNSTLYTGAEGSSSAWRIMIKRIDRQNKVAGTFEVLDSKDHRVRLEVTLLEPELSDRGLVTLEDLGKFSLQKLQGSYFQFKLPTFATTEHEGALRAVLEEREQSRRAKFMKTGVIGLQAMDDAWDRRMRQMRREGSKDGKRVPLPPRLGSSLVNYEELSLKVAHSLRHLSNRQRRSIA